MRSCLRGWSPVGPVLFAALLAAPPAGADARGDKALGEMEQAMNRGKTHYFEYELVNQEPGKAEKKLGLKVFIKGGKRLAELTAPGDMKGTKLLILSTTEMYVYLPAFGKVRRISSSNTDQGIMGLAFNQNDLATQTYSPSYQAQLASETTTEWKIAATPKAGQTTAYGKIEFTVTRDKKVPTEIKYHNAAGTLVRTETRTSYKCQADVCVPGELKMVDHAKGGHSTKVLSKAWKLNENLSDDLFTKRSLGQ